MEMLSHGEGIRSPSTLVNIVGVRPRWRYVLSSPFVIDISDAKLHNFTVFHVLT